ncbi:hypothetical protein [Rhodococcus kronopolitis]|uniref:Uncharacterized protein n=1 Tax=Rhodococcus kronopolitis TaxID=1460226 RepID=A0ABV9FVF0_9NOCA
MDATMLADGIGFTEGPILLPGNRTAAVSMSRGAVLVLDRDGTDVVGPGGALEASHRLPAGSMPTDICCGAVGPEGRVRARPYHVTVVRRCLADLVVPKGPRAPVCGRRTAHRHRRPMPTDDLHPVRQGMNNF